MLRRVLLHTLSILRYIPLHVISYSPPELWTQGSNCPSCAVHSPIVDLSRTNSGTWHNAIFYPGSPARVIQATFNGTAIYVYNLVANVVGQSVTTITNLSFSLDGEYAGGYSHFPTGEEPEIQYDVLVYHNAGLSNAKHTITVEATGSHSSLVLFDYMVYTSDTLADPGLDVETNTPPPPPSSGAPASSTPSPPSGQSKSTILVGAIVGASIGIVVSLTIVIAIYVLRKRGVSLLPLHRTGKRETRPKPRLDTPSPPSVPADETASLSLLLPPSNSFNAHSPTPPSAASSCRGSMETVQRRGPDEVFFVATPPSPTPRNSDHRAYNPFLSTPPAHRVDVPAPALSATGTDYSIHLEELRQEIRTLEDAVRGFHNGSMGKSSDSSSTGSRASFATLQARVVRLREQLEKEKRLMTEALPRGKR